MLDVTWRDRKQAPWIREQTKVEDIVSTVKQKKLTRVIHFVLKTDKLTIKVTERQPRNCRRSQGRQRTRWRDEIRAFTGAGWSTLTPDRGPGGEMRLEHLPGLDEVH